MDSGVRSSAVVSRYWQALPVRRERAPPRCRCRLYARPGLDSDGNAHAARPVLSIVAQDDGQPLICEAGRTQFADECRSVPGASARPAPRLRRDRSELAGYPAGRCVRAAPTSRAVAKTFCLIESCRSRASRLRSSIAASSSRVASRVWKLFGHAVEILPKLANLIAGGIAHLDRELTFAPGFRRLGDAAQPAGDIARDQ